MVSGDGESLTYIRNLWPSLDTAKGLRIPAPWGVAILVLNNSIGLPGSKPLYHETGTAIKVRLGER